MYTVQYSRIKADYVQYSRNKAYYVHCASLQDQSLLSTVLQVTTEFQLETIQLWNELEENDKRRFYLLAKLDKKREISMVKTFSINYWNK